MRKILLTIIVIFLTSCGRGVWFKTYYSEVAYFKLYNAELDSILIITPLEVYSIPDSIWDESDLEAIVMKDVE